MDKYKAWDKFITTGNIQDYLAYCSAEQSLKYKGQNKHDDKNRGYYTKPEELQGFGKIHDDFDKGTGFN